MEPPLGVCVQHRQSRAGTGAGNDAHHRIRIRTELSSVHSSCSSQTCSKLGHRLIFRSKALRGWSAMA